MDTLESYSKHRCGVTSAVCGKLFCDQPTEPIDLINRPCVRQQGEKNIFCPHIVELYKQISVDSIPGCRTTLAATKISTQALITVTSSGTRKPLEVVMTNGATDVDLTPLEECIDKESEAYTLIRDRLAR